MEKYKIFDTYEKQIKDANKFRGLPLYRFFKNEWEAECLLNGKVWISTLKKCREFECPQQGDLDEATAVFQQGYLDIDNRVVTEYDFQTAAHLGIEIPPPGDFHYGRLTIKNCRMYHKIPNGFLLCTTNTPSGLQEQSDQWKYGVEITLKQKNLFRILTNAMIRQNIPIISCYHAWANYDKQRIYHDYHQAPKHLAFIKPELHRAQSEYRFFWLASNEFEYPDGILIDCPEIKPFLKQIY